MGLFSFLKKAGSSILRREIDTKKADASAAESDKKNRIFAIESKIRSLGILIDNFEVELIDNNIIAYGQAKSQEHKDRAILALGAMEGISSVDDRISVLIPEPTEETYKVKKGDSLSKIAKKFYGDPMKYMEIFNANRDILKDPNLIYPGQSLKIPKL
jgi:nucleoid-associated protein YgaU